MTARRAVTIVVFAVMLLPGLAVAQECFDPVGRFPYGATEAVVIQGSTAFVGNGAALMVVDLTDPENPLPMGELTFVEKVMSLAVDGDRLYAGTRDRLSVVDVSQPSAPAVIFELPRYWYPRDMSVSGDVLCVLADDLLVFDVSTPLPIEASSRPLDNDTDVELVGQHAFLSTNGLEVLDVSNPYAPVLVGALAGIQGQLDAEGDILYSASDGDFRVIDIHDPSLPALLGSETFSGTVRDVAAAGELAFVSTAIDGLFVVDVENPAEPSVVGSAPATGASGNERWVKVAAMGEVAAVATVDHGIRVISAADPADPIEVAAIDSVAYGDGAALSNDVVFIAAEYRGLRVVDVSDPADPKNMTIFDLGGWPSGVAAVGDLVYTAHPRLKIMDASDPSQPVIIGEDPNLWGDPIEVVGGFAYVAKESFGLQVVDVSDPEVPVEVGSLDLGDEIWHSLDVLGDLAAVRSGGTIAIVDVSEPTDPVLRSSFDPGWSLTGPVLYRSYLLFATSRLLYTYDLSDPDHPAEVNELDVVNYIGGINVAGSVAYLGTFLEGGPGPTWVEAWDIGDPANPTLIGTRADAGSVQHFVFDEDHVFTIRVDSGFDVFTLCLDPLFADDFELGNTDAWSSAVP